MGHGFMGLRAPGFAALAISTGFFYYLSTSYKGPDEPKYQLDREFVMMAKEYQPGIVPEYYIKKDKAQ